MIRAMVQFVVLITALVVCATNTLAQKRYRTPVASGASVVASSNDTITSLAEKNNVAAGDLARLNRLRITAKLRKGQRLLLPAAANAPAANPAEGTDGAQVTGKRILLADGRTLVVDDAWKQGEVLWYSRGGVTQSLDREVRKIEPVFATRKTPETTAAIKAPEPKPAPEKSVWIHLVGGARFKVDDVNETASGAWYHRGTLSVFVDRERIARIERDDSGSAPGGYRGRDWASGSAYIDQLIKTNAARMRLDPYLVFLVIEQESHFRPRALSPKGARGLMQLMPGTARRFGVSRPFDPAENVRAGTQYLRELMDTFGGQVNLVLASYNAGEGAVMKYGRNVPPYRETREYVKKIGKRYGMSGRQLQDDNEAPVPRR